MATKKPQPKKTTKVVSPKPAQAPVLRRQKTIEEAIQEAPEAPRELSEFTVIDSAGVLKSKGFVQGLINYPTPEQLLMPVLATFRNYVKSVTIQGDGEVKNANEDGTENVSFGRLAVIAEIEVDDELTYRIGFTAALNMRVGKVKIFRGVNVRACTNQCIFGNTDDVIKFDIATGNNIETLRVFLANYAEHLQKALATIQRMKAIHLTPEALRTITGALLFEAESRRSEAGTIAINNAVKLMVDPQGIYNAANGLNLWKYYNAVTEYYTEKSDFFDIPTKTASFTGMLFNRVNPHSYELANILQ